MTSSIKASGRHINSEQNVRRLTVGEDETPQRLDNFLFRKLAKVPKSRVYRLIRKGEVRVNGKRTKPHYKLADGDEVRIPPVWQVERKPDTRPSSKIAAELHKAVILETPDLMVFNKPAGWAVHGGDGVSLGFIETARVAFPDGAKLELAHRLDRDTSGCLVIARNRATLRLLHDAFRNNKIKKEYVCVASGQWPKEEAGRVVLPIKRFVLANGERRAKVSQDGKVSITEFKQLKTMSHATLLNALPVTGRTHQIRVHAATLGYPLLGDEKYGDKNANRLARDLGYSGLALHARKLSFTLAGEPVEVEARLPVKLQKFVEKLENLHLT